MPQPRSYMLLLTLLTGLFACSPPNEQPVQVKLRVLETSDLHANMLDFNYYSGQTDPSLGLARTASLIKAARAQVQNSVLVDNGDLIQGSPLGDYIAQRGLAEGEIHPIMLALNTLNYDVATLGNHEFNFGLPFLYQTLAGANFPYTSANIYCATTQCRPGVKQGDHLYPPYILQQKHVIDTQGQPQQITIGYIGFVPPQIMSWDKQHLHGQLRVDSIIDTAKRMVPEMQAAGADVIIAIAHSGLGHTGAEVDPMAENMVYALTQVPGIATVLFGHSHAVFPAAQFQHLPSADITQGLLNGIPAVMPGRWGDHLGLVDLTLQQNAGKWQVVSAQAQTLAVFDNATQQPNVEADAAIVAAVAEAHKGTIAFMQRSIGMASADMYSFLAQIQDDPTVQLVADAQRARVAELLPPELQDIPLLSAAAPFKAGGKLASPNDAEQYIQVSQGPLSFRNAADLYLYPNTVVAVKLNGAELKDWLECSANQFLQIDLTSTAPQTLINLAHSSYNFDVIDGIYYQIDVSQPSKFNQRCELVNASANRIVDLRYTDASGKVYRDAEFAAKSFIVATNNYRAYTGMFAGTGSDKVVLELPDTNREALVAYIEQQSQYDAASDRYLSAVNPQADHNWRLLPLKSAVQLDLRFKTRDSAAAQQFIQANNYWPMTKLSSDNVGFAEYRLDLQVAAPAN
ncbi:bifunctional 2',3'-cyclic-nucleotide 2'-phosphodiesterase/3'-nucleotidase [Alishewanella sp. HL-SH06]|uniref:bifunctional 2',3'-cyclic-nucleotide 2'-phosphodiesterase/3'-nucleotidase n=1 Tax=Alishewanella sp. HL-SH06 TaxID=3461144 RepID=UPI0040439496